VGNTVYLGAGPDRTKIGAGLAGGALYSVGARMLEDDLVLCPDDEKRYRVGKVCGPYYYAIEEPYHRRPVHWLEKSFSRNDMSSSFLAAADVPLTVTNISSHGGEIVTLLGEPIAGTSVADVDCIVDPFAFRMENHLEEFLVGNWSKLDLAKEYGIFAENGVYGVRYRTDTRDEIDILAISKDKKKLLVIELKRGRASDVVVGQILRYMGYISEKKRDDQIVEGLIIAYEDDSKIHQVLSIVNGVRFCRYEIDFKLTAC
jgi:restriction system protein